MLRVQLRRRRQVPDTGHGLTDRSAAACRNQRQSQVGSGEPRSVCFRTQAVTPEPGGGADSRFEQIDRGPRLLDA